MAQIRTHSWRLLAVTGLLATLLAAVAPAGAAGPDSDESWIVVMQPGRDVGAEAPGLANAAGGSVRHVYEHVLGGFSFRGSAAAAAALERNPNVRAVVPDGTVQLADVAGWGFFRIDAELSFATPNAYRGAGTRIAVIDTGLDLDHTDFVANVDIANSMNCIDQEASADDDNSHGTHVAGIAGADDDGDGLVGIAPDATILPLKALDAVGFGSDSEIVCAMNHLAGLMINQPMPTVLNMSFVDNGAVTPCDDADVTDVMHEAICDLDDLGVIMVGAAGNSFQDMATTVPAIFPEVIAVSAYADRDGKAGGLGGCGFDPNFVYGCDDTFASFSNHGLDVDVLAPGFDIYSTVPSGHGRKSGTSMAAPHVTGVVSIMLAENPSLDRTQILSILQNTGECPDGSINADGGTCAGAGTWSGDPDGVPEPLINALRAAQAADTGSPQNQAPTAGFTDSCVAFDCAFTDTSTDSDGTITSWSWDFGDGNTSIQQHPSHTFGGPGTYDVSLTVTDDDGDIDTATTPVTVTDAPPQNLPPIADAGSDQAVPDTKKPGSETVRLDGTGSTDPDGTITDYVWTDAQGGIIATGANPQVTLDVGTHDITLEVTDNDEATATASVTITVGDPPPTGNTPPTADAGPDQTVEADDYSDPENPTATITLDGSGSSDSDGTIVNHSWAWSGGSATGTSLTVTLPIGINTVMLTVTDDAGATDTDTVVVTVDLPPIGGPTHVETLTATTTKDKSKWSAIVEVFVVWANTELVGDPVGADPTTVTFSTSTGETLECVTVNNPGDDNDGRCTVTLSNLHKRTSSVTFDVTEVWTPGGTYDPDHPHDTTQIVVNAP